MATTSYFSIVEFPGDGTTTEWDFSFAGGYIDRTHVKALSRDEFGAPTVIELVDTDFITESRLQIIPAIPVGHTLRIYRDTPKEEPLVDFTGGSNFTESNLDVLAQQTIFVAAEAFDAGAYAVANDLLGQAQTAASQANSALAAALQAEIDTALSAAQAAQRVVDAQAVVDAGALSIGNQTAAAINSLNALSDSSEADLNAVAATQLAAMQLKVDAAEQSADEAAASALSINPSNLVHRTGDESIAGVKTFTSRPKVPSGASGDEPPQAQEIPALLGIVGAVLGFARNTAPAGWLKCNGATVSRTVYADLFAVIGTAFGAGDGSTTFNLPDFRGNFMRGWADGGSVDSGRAFGSIQLDGMKQAVFDIRGDSNGNGSVYPIAGEVSTGWGPASTTMTVNGTARALQRVYIGEGSEYRPRNVAVLVCIKY